MNESLEAASPKGVGAGIDNPAAAGPLDEKRVDGGDGIAIVVVTRNQRAALEDTIRAVLDLGDPRVRLSVVDGAATDGTVEYLKTLDASRVEWVSEPDAGIYDAMNKGWRRVPDDHYVLYMGAGDKPLSLPTSKSLRTAAESGIRVMQGDCTIGDRSFESVWTAGLYRGNTAHHQALMVHKSLHPSPPFDVTLKVYADWEFNMRLFKRGERAQHDSNFRSFALPGGISTNVHLWEVLRVCARHTGLFNTLRAVQLNWRLQRSIARRPIEPS